MKGFWGLLKTNFHLSIQNNLLLATLYLLIVPIMRGIENLDKVHSAQCLEQSVIFIGILLIVPLYAAEQKRAIREVVLTRKIPQWTILFIRIVMAVIMLTFLTGVFAKIMIIKNCTFPYASFVMGTVISEIVLGSMGLFAAVQSNSVIAGYLVSIGYFLFNYLGNISGTNIFCLFSMETDNFITKIWLLWISILLITVTLLYVKKKSFLNNSLLPAK
ncbi:MAG: hypothetical protein HFG34_01840 [Eubacterium sp.]|nr:hypothetical protein [Eubacterium sp.]